MTDLRSDPGVRWLLDAGDASVRYFTLTDVLGLTSRSPAVRAAQAEIPGSERVQALLHAQVDGQDVRAIHPYKKWGGAHWRLVSLVELGLPLGNSRAVALLENVLGWLTSPMHRRGIKSIDGRTRRCASQEGNALAVATRLGLASDERAQLLGRSLIEWQWPDGGWNCDKKPTACHSSFYESLCPLWGLAEFAKASGDPAASRAVERGREMFLRHQLFRSCSNGEAINADWTRLHYPVYWHYDVLQALLILSRSGGLDDPRCAEALDVVASKRTADGLWGAEHSFWLRPGRKGSNVEVVNWGSRGPNEMITLNALRVLKAAGQL